MNSGGSHPLDLGAIRARVEAATAGPWHGEHDEFGCVSQGDYGWVCPGPSFPAYDVDSEQGKADAEFIAHARTDVPALLAEVERLTSELAEKNARNARLEELFQERVENRRWMVGELRGHNSRRGKLMEFLDLHENSEDLSRWAQTEIRSIFTGEIDESSVNAELDPVREEAEAVRLDAQLADVQRRVAADKRLLDAADALFDVSETLRHPMSDPFRAFAAAVRARRALVEVEETPQDHCGACNDTRWEDDQNWQPEQWELRAGRRPGAGRIPCGLCNLGGWSIPDGVEATPQHAPSNSQPWEQEAMKPMPGKAVTQALQQLRVHYSSAVDRDGEVER